MSSDRKVVVVGAGIGGLVASLTLAQQGAQVILLDKADAPGGKMREAALGEARIDAGPTVLTMRWVFDALFESAGTSLDARVGLTPLSVLARHAWSGGACLDLFADQERSAEAIGAFAGSREADGFRAFCDRAGKIYRMLEGPFIEAPCASPQALMKAVGLRGLPGLSSIAPFTTMHQALKKYFRDPRLLQLFGRYATYCGSSPYEAPATLMLVAHVEQRGVWSVEGGMHRLAVALADLCREHGVSIRYGMRAERIDVRGNRVRGVATSGEDYLEADTVVVNGDAQAVAAGLFGKAAASAVDRITPAQRSLSAVTWAMVASCSGFPLLRHNVFFSDDYAREFDELFQKQRLPSAPTVYVCAQERRDVAPAQDPPDERLLCLINAPAVGDTRRFDLKDIQSCEEQSRSLLKRCGLTLTCAPGNVARTDPASFNQLFPATGGALYGRASHGWNASFQRPAARTRIGGLYLAGGSTHPGPGVPMAALSGRMAAQAILEDHASTSRSKTTAMPGGISTA